jgi:hypothetical protein
VSIPETDFTKTDNKLPNLHICIFLVIVPIFLINSPVQLLYELLPSLGVRRRPSVLIVFPEIEFSDSMLASASRKIFRI